MTITLLIPSDFKASMWEESKIDPDEIILLPLYPQYSASTSGSSINEWKDICNKNNYTKPTKTICCYPIDVEFLNAHISLIKEEISNLENFKLIFSAHGLPERNIKKGDPYQWQIESSVNEIVKNLNHPDLDWILSYQSRVGPLKWIGPSTDDEIINASKLNQTILSFLIRISPYYLSIISIWLSLPT